MAAVTYTASPSIAGPTFTCKRCQRVYAYPTAAKPIRCECGWWYSVANGRLFEQYKTRIGGAPEN